MYIDKYPLITSILTLLTLFVIPEVKGEILTGKVYTQQEESPEPLPFASVYISETGAGTTTDEQGNFRFEGLEAGRYTLEIRHLGYRSRQKAIEIIEGAENHVEIQLIAYGVDQDEVTISGRTVMTTAEYQPVQSLDRSNLESRHASSLGEMMEGEPGLNNRSFGSAPSRPVIRGYDGERLLILENGERMGDVQESAHDHAVSTDPLAIDRIETIRGPASLIYGSNAIGGVVNLYTNHIPRRTEKGLSGRTYLRGASANNHFHGGARLQHGWDQWNVQGRLSYQDESNIQTPEGELYGSWSNMISASTGASYNNDNFTGGLSLSWNRQEYGLPEYEAETDPENEDHFVETSPDIDLIMDRINLATEMTWFREGFFEALEWRASYSWLEQEEREWESSDDYDLELHFLQNTLSTSLTMRHGQYGRFETGTLGFNLLATEMDIGGDEAFHPGQQFISPAIFIFEEIRLTPDLYWQAGARAEYRFMETVPNHLFPDFRQSHNYFNLSGSTGLNYQLPYNIETGFQLARAYRPPSITELYADGWHAGAGRLEAGNPELKPEISHGIDVFVNYSSADLTGEVTAFYNQLDNYIAPFELPPGCPDREFRTEGGSGYARCIEYRATDAVIWGIETYWAYNLGNDFNTNIQFDLVRGNRVDEETKHLPFMPPPRIQGGIHYKSSTWEGGISAKGAFAQELVAENELETPGYLIPQISAGYNLNMMGNHRIMLKVENILDQVYYSHLSRVRRYPDAEQGPYAPERFPQPGRNITLAIFSNF